MRGFVCWIKFPSQVLTNVVLRCGINIISNLNNWVYVANVTPITDKIKSVNDILNLINQSVPILCVVCINIPPFIKIYDRYVQQYMHFVIAIINNKDLNKHKGESPYLYIHLALIIPCFISSIYLGGVHVSIVYEDAGHIRFSVFQSLAKLSLARKHINAGMCDSHSVE